MLEGTLVAVPVRLGGILPILHVGILSPDQGPDGRRTILHNSRRYGQCVETLAADFLYGQTGRAVLLGYPGCLPPGAVVERARERLGAPYRTATYNCEHYAADCHGIAIASPQWLAWQRALVRVCLDPWGRQAPTHLKQHSFEVP